MSASFSSTRLAEYFLVEDVLAFDANMAKRRLALERRHTAPGIICNIYGSYNNISHAFSIGICLFVPFDAAHGTLMGF